MNLSMTAIAGTVIALLSTHVLPALAAVQQEITPDTTADQLTAKLETSARNYVASEFGSVEAIVIFDIPTVRTDLDKAISAVVAKVLPIAKSNTVQQIEQDAPLAVAVLGSVVDNSGTSTPTATPPFTGSIAPPITQLPAA